MLLNLINPIPDAIRDQKELQDIFEKYAIIPYYGNDEGTSHSILELLSDLTTLSPSHKSCKKDIKKYAFSSRVNIVPRPIPGLLIPDVIKLTPEKISSFNDNFLNPLNIKLPKVISDNRELFDNITDSGNGYLRIRIVTVAGTTKVFFKVLHYKHVAYLRTKKNEDRVLIYTKKWNDETYWSKVKPQQYKASYIGKPFNWDSKSNGTIKETVIHFSNKNDESDYYGRPDILSVLYWMFVEWTQADLSVKIGSTEFVSKLLIAFEEADPTRTKKGSDSESKSNKFRKKMMTLRKLTTGEGDFGEAKSLAGISYPYGGKPPSAIKLDINRDVAFSEHQIDKASSYIYSVNSWDKQLTGFEPARSNIGGNVIIDLFTVKNMGTILPLQNDWSEVWSEIFNAIAIETEYKGDVYTIQYPNLIKDLVEQLIASKSGKTEEILETEVVKTQEELKLEVENVNKRINDVLKDNELLRKLIEDV